MPDQRKGKVFLGAKKRTGMKNFSVLISRDVFSGASSNQKASQKNIKEAKMIKEKVTPELMKYAKERLGASEEQLKNFTDTQWRILKATPLRHQYRMVAEVISVFDSCTAQHKVGQKYVCSASGYLLPEECTVTQLCLWAMPPLLNFIYVVYDRLSEGLDPTPRGYDRMQCYDCGLDCGGFGRVVFKIYCEKNP